MLKFMQLLRKWHLSCQSVGQNFIKLVKPKISNYEDFVICNQS